MGSCRLGLVMVDDGKEASNLYFDVQVCVPKVDDIQLSTLGQFGNCQKCWRLETGEFPHVDTEALGWNMQNWWHISPIPPLVVSHNPKVQTIIVPSHPGFCFSMVLPLIFKQNHMGSLKMGVPKTIGFKQKPQWILDDLEVPLFGNLHAKHDQTCGPLPPISPPRRGQCLRDCLRKLAVYETSWLRNMQCPRFVVDGKETPSNWLVDE